MQNYEKFKFREIGKDEYEALCKSRNIPLTQHWFYGEWQIATGKRVWRYSVKDGGRIVSFFQVIKYPMPFAKNYLYIPHGPVFTGEVSSELLTEFNIFCHELLKKEKAVFLRHDSECGHCERSEAISEINSQRLLCRVTPRNDSLFCCRFRKVPKFMYDGSFQPKFEWVLDLSQTEEEILAGMKKVNRYTIRQAEKLGVDVEIIENNFKQYLDKFYELIEATAERDGFSHNSKEYYAKIFEECERNKNAFMEVAHYEGEIMLVNFFVVYGDSVFFLFSGSENEHRRVGYTYLAQWEVIKYAKKLGLKKYNFGAVIPDDNRYLFYRTWQGFSDFKRRFGGSLVAYADFRDVVKDWFWYDLYVLRRLLASIRRCFDF